MTIDRILEARVLLTRLTTIVYDATSKGVNVRDLFFAILRELDGATIHGSNGELVRLRRLVARDAFGLQVRGDPLVSQIIAQIDAQKDFRPKVQATGIVELEGDGRRVVSFIDPTSLIRRLRRRK